MATIVRPYNDWRERAFVNFLGPIVGDWIKSSREAEQNRKLNAAGAQVLQRLAETQSPTPSLMSSPTQSINGWENAFHQTENPLLGYDMGTSNIAPSQPRPLTQAEIQQAIIRTLGEDPKRFGMLNPASVQASMQPYLQANEAARIEQQKAGLVDTLKAAKDAAEKRDAMLGGYVMGDVPLEGLNAVQQQYQYDNPYLQPQTYNAGGQTYAWNFNPVTGERTNMMSIENTLTPQQVQAGQQWRTQFGENQRVFDTQTALTREARAQQQGQFEAEYKLKERQQREAEEKARFEREHPELRREYDENGNLYYVNARTGKAVYVETPDGKRVKVDPLLQGSVGSSRYYQGLDGNYYRVNPYGVATPVVRPDGTPLTAPQKNTTASNKDLADSQKLELNRLNKREEELNKQIAAINSRMQVFADDPAMYKELQRQRNEVSSQLSQIEQQRNTILGKAQPSRPQQAQPQGQTMRINIPDEIVYNPSRDANVPQNKVMTADQFRNWVNHIMEDPRAANLTPEQIIQRAIQMGIRISPEAQAQSTASGDVPAQPVSPDIPPAVSPDVPATPTSGDMVVLPPSVSGDVSSGDRTISTPTASDLGYVPQEPPSDATDANVERVMRENQPEPVSQAPSYDLTAGRSGTARQTFGSLGTQILANANGGRVSRNGEFGNNRKTHSHAGTDYPAAGGTPIRMQSSMGSSLKVTKVNTNPKASGYGNYVVLEGKVGGQNVSFLMAHMKTGSVAVKVGDTVRPGDIIGQVGSTGRSTGNHLHLEVRLNGKRIDPEKYYEVMGPYTRQEGQAQSYSYNVLPKAQDEENEPQIQTIPYTPENEDPYPIVYATDPPIYADRNGVPAPENTQKLLRARDRFRSWQDESSESIQPLQRQNLGTRRRPRAQAPVQGHVRGNPKVKTSYQQIRSTVDSSANRHGVSSDLIRAIIQAESSWQPNARSKAGAMGLMQLMPNTARELGVRNAYDPAQNIDGGTKYIAQLIRRYKGNIQKAVMAYNAGPGNIDKGRIPRETQNYVRKVMNIYSKLRQRRG